jgi:hypothetical protein
MKTNICIATLLFVNITVFAQTLSIKKFDSLLPLISSSIKAEAETSTSFNKYIDLGEGFINQNDTPEWEIIDGEQETWFMRETPLIGKADKFNNVKFRVLAFEINKTMKKGLTDITAIQVK